MREIKFSCMWTDGESWMDLRYTLEQMENGMHWEEMSDNPMLRKFKLKHKRQFTGLKDRNGVEVYEGDIIDVLDGIDTKAVIVFDDETAAFCCDYLFEGGKSDHLYGIELCEVIGNIYQNKELLE